jgi:hypothetical protein
MKVENSLRFNNTYEDYHQRQNEIERELHKLEQDRQTDKETGNGIIFNKY